MIWIEAFPYSIYLPRKLIKTTSRYHKQGQSAKNPRVSSDENQPSELTMSLFPTDVSDPSGLVFERLLFSIEIQAHAFLGREFQQTLKNLNLEWGGLGGEDMKRKISKHSMLRHFLKEKPT